MRRFQIEQQDDDVPVPTMNSIVSALRFFFTHVPIVAKEVGSGLSASVASARVEAGVALIDAAGAGGTTSALPTVKLIASGGIRDGGDVAKAIRLGADFAGQAAGMLPAATVSTEPVHSHLFNDCFTVQPVRSKTRLFENRR